MAFTIDITEPALDDAADYAAFIRDIKKEPLAAERWYRGLVRAIHSRADLPDRCPLIPEHARFPELRHLMYHSHRIIFRVEHGAKRVVVYRVFHASRRRLARKHLSC